MRSRETSFAPSLYRVSTDTLILSRDTERNMETAFQLDVGVCCLLQTCNSVLNMFILGLGLKQSLKSYIPLVSSYVQKYISSLLCLCCCLHIRCIVYKHLNTICSAHCTIKT